MGQEHCRSFITVPRAALLALLTCGAATAAEVDPYIGFLGDGTAVYPDCRPETEWSEYSYEQRKRGRMKWDEPTGEQVKNIVWKTELPMWGNGQPIIVDGNIYLMHEMPYWDLVSLGPSLVCLDPADGSVRWSKEVHHLDMLPSSQARELVELWLAERQLVVDKWRLAWRMHLADPKDQEEIDAIWQKAVALGVTKKDDKKYGTKLGDNDMGDTGRFWKGRPEGYGERMTRLKEHGLFHPSWGELSMITPGRWMGETFPTPVSDGEHIWVRTARHLLACFDLDGEQQWMIRYTQAEGYCDFAPSPILVGDVLVLYSSASRNSDKVIARGFDKASGRQLWQIPGGAPSYAIGTPAILTLASARQVVFLPSGHVIDPQDGKILCEVPCHLAAADNPIAQGDVVYMRNSQSGGGYGGDEKGVPKSLQAIRVVEQGGTVEAEVLWRKVTGEDGKGFSTGLVVLDGLLFTQADKGVSVLDAANGTVLNHAKTGGKSWNIYSAGGYIFSGDDRSAEATVLSGDRELRTIGRQQVSQPKKIPADQWHYRNEKQNWGVIGTPFPMTFSGNRIFLRTWFDLYCIGNPKTPLRLSPRNR